MFKFNWPVKREREKQTTSWFLLAERNIEKVEQKDVKNRNRN